MSPRLCVVSIHSARGTVLVCQTSVYRVTRVTDIRTVGGWNFSTTYKKKIFELSQPKQIVSSRSKKCHEDLILYKSSFLRLIRCNSKFKNWVKTLRDCFILLQFKKCNVFLRVWNPEPIKIIQRKTYFIKFVSSTEVLFSFERGQGGIFLQSRNYYKRRSLITWYKRLFLGRQRLSYNGQI